MVEGSFPLSSRCGLKSKIKRWFCCSWILGSFYDQFINLLQSRRKCLDKLLVETAEVGVSTGCEPFYLKARDFILQLFFNVSSLWCRWIHTVETPERCVCVLLASKGKVPLMKTWWTSSVFDEKRLVLTMWDLDIHHFIHPVWHKNGFSVYLWTASPQMFIG